MIIIGMYVMSCVQPATGRGKNFTAGCNTQTVQLNFLIPAMLIGTINNYHVIPLTLTLLGVTRPVQSRTCWSHLLAHFSSYQDEI